MNIDTVQIKSYAIQAFEDLLKEVDRLENKNYNLKVKNDIYKKENQELLKTIEDLKIKNKLGIDIEDIT